MYKNFLKEACIVISVVFLISMINPLNASSKIEYQQNNLRTILVPDDYSTIQEAIDNANDGDIINVKTKVKDEIIVAYDETIIIDKPLKIFGEDIKSTIISGDSEKHVVTIQSGDVEFGSFTVRNSGAEKAGIYIQDQYDVKIAMTLVEKNGYGIILKECGEITLVDNIIDDNANSGIELDESFGIILRENVIKNNFNNGVIVGGLSQANEIKGNTIKANGVGARKLGIQSEQVAGVVFEIGTQNNNLIGNHLDGNIIGIDSKTDSEYNTAESNDLTNNIEVNARDDSELNSWTGNHWDDYTGIDENGDGIGDTEYDVPGDGNNKDIMPITSPIIPIAPDIEGPTSVKIRSEAVYKVYTPQPTERCRNVYYKIKYTSMSVAWDEVTENTVDAATGYNFAKQWLEPTTCCVIAKSYYIHDGKEVTSEPTFLVVSVKLSKDYYRDLLLENLIQNNPILKKLSYHNTPPIKDSNNNIKIKDYTINENNFRLENNFFEISDIVIKNFHFRKI